MAVYACGIVAAVAFILGMGPDRDAVSNRYLVLAILACAIALVLSPSELVP